MNKITPFLWFDTQAEEAANFYVSVFKNGRILKTVRYGDTGPGPKGTVMTISFEINGQEFAALNGGPQFKFSEGDLIRSQLRDAERNRRAVGEAVRWRWQGRPLRMGAGQVRTVVADRPAGIA
jgi:predicted 3-demethylubiquinone-9 3-methyltransferase (glyoxalase superfamily)